MSLLLLFGCICTALAAPQVADSPTFTNPWVPNRDTAPPTSSPTPVSTSSFQRYQFVVKDFLIALGIVFIVLGLLVGMMVLIRAFRKKDVNLAFEKEEAALNMRSNSIRDPRRGAQGMRGDMGPLMK
jgi:hypothetical protein